MSITQSASSVRPPEPDLTAEELLERAKAMAPTLVARQEETERRTHYAEDTHEAFREAGFYRMLTPRRFGGYEIDLPTYFRIIREFMCACPSTGWLLSRGTSHAITAATFFSERAQEEIFADGDFMAPLTVKAQGVATRADDGGWEITGTFNYCSSAPYSTHLMAHAVPAEETPGVPSLPMFFIAPRSAYTVLDDWGDVLGLKGSGSHSIKVERAHIPSDFALPGETFVTLDPREAPGRALHGNAMYAGSSYSFYRIVGATNAFGTVLGAVEEYERLMRTASIPNEPSSARLDDPDYQRWFGAALGQMATAEAALNDFVRQWLDLAERNAWTQEDDLRLGAIGQEVINNLCWEAIHNLVRTAGSSSIRAGQRMERVWRDFTQIYTHGRSYTHDLNNRSLALERATGSTSETWSEHARRLHRA